MYHWPEFLLVFPKTLPFLGLMFDEMRPNWLPWGQGLNSPGESQEEFFWGEPKNVFETWKEWKQTIIFLLPCHVWFSGVLLMDLLMIPYFVDS